MITVVLDTNFLVYCAENKIDYASGIAEIMEEGYELAVPSLVLMELSEMQKNAEKLSDRNASRLALKILEHNKARVLKSFGNYADEEIMRLAKEKGVIVATLDLDLRKKLKTSRIIVIKGKKKVAFD